MEPVVLLAMSDAEIMARVAPAARPVSYGGRALPDFAHIHEELTWPRRARSKPNRRGQRRSVKISANVHVPASCAHAA